MRVSLRGGRGRRGSTKNDCETIGKPVFGDVDHDTCFLVARGTARDTVPRLSDPHRNRATVASERVNWIPEQVLPAWILLLAGL